MPRTTRATAMRNNAIHEDTPDPADVPLPATPQRDRDIRSRAPLGEIVVNQVEQQEEEQPRNIILEVDLSKPAKKAKAAKGKKEKVSGPSKPKKTNNKHHGTKEDKDTNKENVPVSAPEVEEDECQSSASSAVEEACENLMRKLGKARSAHEKIQANEPRTPPSKAARAARKQLSPKQQTPRFDPSVHKCRDSFVMVGNSQDNGGNEDSFVKDIESRSPAKHANADAHVKTYGVEEEQIKREGKEQGTATATHKGAEDSLRVAQPDDLCSPPKPYQRIEDSVEALDALEDAIEKLGESLPAIADEPQSPVKSRKENIENLNSTKPTTEVQKRVKSQAIVTSISGVTNNNNRTKAAPTKVERKPTVASVDRKKAAVTATNTSVPTSKTAAGRKPSPATVAAGSAPPTKPVIARRPVTKPIETHLTIRRRPSENPTKVNSASASTTANTAKANPTPTQPLVAKRRVSSLSKAPFVPIKSTKRPTTSSFTLPGEAVSAKLKVAREEREAAAATATAAASSTIASPVSTTKMPIGGSMRVKPTAARPSVQQLRRNRVSSAAAVASIPIATNTPNRANTSAPRAAVAQAKSTKTATSALTATTHGPSGGTLTAKDEQRFRREREEAARKARAEAAERGRAASREWAEKMRVREEERKRKAKMARMAKVVGDVTVAEVAGEDAVAVKV